MGSTRRQIGQADRWMSMQGLAAVLWSAMRPPATSPRGHKKQADVDCGGHGGQGLLHCTTHALFDFPAGQGGSSVA